MQSPCALPGLSASVGLACGRWSILLPGQRGFPRGPKQLMLPLVVVGAWMGAAAVAQGRGKGAGVYVKPSSLLCSSWHLFNVTLQAGSPYLRPHLGPSWSKASPLLLQSAEQNPSCCLTRTGRWGFGCQQSPAPPVSPPASSTGALHSQKAPDGLCRCSWRWQCAVQPPQLEEDVAQEMLQCLGRRSQDAQAGPCILLGGDVGMHLLCVAGGVLGVPTSSLTPTEDPNQAEGKDSPDVLHWGHQPGHGAAFPSALAHCCIPSPRWGRCPSTGSQGGFGFAAPLPSQAVDTGMATVSQRVPQTHPSPHNTPGKEGAARFRVLIHPPSPPSPGMLMSAAAGEGVPGGGCSHCTPSLSSAGFQSTGKAAEGAAGAGGTGVRARRGSPRLPGAVPGVGEASGGLWMKGGGRAAAGLQAPAPALRTACGARVFPDLLCYLPAH